MNHLEELVKQYYEWRGYLVRTNVKVGRLSHGGWDGELDIVAYHPLTNHLIHLEPSIDANSWSRREDRFDHKFKVGRQYIRNDVFPWVDTSTPIQQVAILPTSSRKELAGGEVISIDELMKEIKEAVVKAGVMAKNAIPEEYDLLRTIQMTVCGYHRTV
jgi:hypothetical protein|tara:strand:+ start:93 stop:569 length:477 start_codon:yes stop_codon:yes gene_type:complete